MSREGLPAAPSREAARVYEFGPFSLDPARAALLCSGRPVHLPPKAFDTLLLLVERDGELVTKQDLMRAIWPDTFVTPGNIAVTVHALRKALGEQRDGHSYIETVPRRGYRFRAAVTARRERDAPAPPSDLPAPTPAVAARMPKGVDRSFPSALSKRPWLERVASLRPRRAAMWGLAIVGLMLLGWVSSVGVRLTGPSAVDDIRITRLTATSRVQDGAISPDGTFVVYTARMPEGDSLRLLHLASRREREILEPTDGIHQGLTFSPDGQHVYYRVRAGQGAWGGSLYRLPTLGGTSELVCNDVAGPPTFSPDRTQLAFVRSSRPGEHELIVARSDCSGQRTLAVRRNGAYFSAERPAWSPDEAHIAVAAGSPGAAMTIVLVRVADGTEHPLTDRTWENIRTLAWLPDGDGLVMDAREAWEQPHQLWRVSYSSGSATPLTHDLSNYSTVTASAGGETLLAIQGDRVANVWVAPTDALGSAIPVTSGTNARHGLYGLAWTPDHHLLYASSTGSGVDIWSVDHAGREATRLTGAGRAYAFPTTAPAGRSVVYVSDRRGQKQLWTMWINGSAPRPLTQGVDDVYPDLSPDGRWVIYQLGDRHRLWKMSVDGGHGEALTNVRATRPRMSPDGRLVACNLWDGKARRWKVALLSFESGRVMKIFDDLPSHPWGILRWTPDGRALTYPRRDDDVVNLWIQPIAGGAPRQLTRLSSGHIYDFAWSYDGRYLAWSHGPLTSDLVLITGFQR